MLMKEKIPRTKLVKIFGRCRVRVSVYFKEHYATVVMVECGSSCGHDQTVYCRLAIVRGMGAAVFDLKFSGRVSLTSRALVPYRMPYALNQTWY